MMKPDVNTNTTIPIYKPPTIRTEGSYPQIFCQIRVGPGCGGVCSRHMPEI